LLWLACSCTASTYGTTTSCGRGCHVRPIDGAGDTPTECLQQCSHPATQGTLPTARAGSWFDQISPESAAAIRVTDIRPAKRQGAESTTGAQRLLPLRLGAVASPNVRGDRTSWTRCSRSKTGRRHEGCGETSGFHAFRMTSPTWTRNGCSPTMKSSWTRAPGSNICQVRSRPCSFWKVLLTKTSDGPSTRTPSF